MRELPCSRHIPEMVTPDQRVLATSGHIDHLINCKNSTGTPSGPSGIEAAHVARDLDQARSDLHVAAAPQFLVFASRRVRTGNVRAADVVVMQV